MEKDEGIVEERRGERAGEKDELASLVNERWAGKTEHIFTRTIHLFNSKNLQVI